MPLIALGAIAIGGAITSGVMAKKGADAQASAVQNASDAATAEQRRQYDLSRQDLAPWRESGGAANQKLAYLLGVGPESNNGTVLPPNAQIPNNTRPMNAYDPNTDYSMDPSARAGFQAHNGADPSMKNYAVWQGNNPSQNTAQPNSQFDPQGGYGSLMKDFSLSDFQTDPGYNFRLGEGAKTLQRSAAANGTLFSGGTLKALDQYNQDFASNEFGNAYNRFNTNKLNRYNMLAGLSQGGQQATNTTVQAGTNAANNISNNLMSAGSQIGDARASGYAGTGMAVNSGINNIIGLYQYSQRHN
jgi:hypothetical protein